MSPGFKDALWKVAAGFMLGNSLAAGRWFGVALAGLACVSFLVASVGTKIVDRRA